MQRGLPRGCDGLARASPTRRGSAHSLRLVADRDLHHDWRMWASRKNKALWSSATLIFTNRRVLAALRAGGTTVLFRHVRAHAGHGMNERPRRQQRLAAQGAQVMRGRGGRMQSTFRPMKASGATGERRLGSARRGPQATSQWIRCRGLRAGGGRGGSERRGAGGTSISFVHSPDQTNIRLKYSTTSSTPSDLLPSPTALSLFYSLTHLAHEHALLAIVRAGTQPRSQ